MRTDKSNRNWRPRHPKCLMSVSEWRVVSLRECPVPESMMRMREPRDAVNYWRRHVARSPQFNPECECVAVIMINSRMRVKGHCMVSVGSSTQVTAEPREVFRTAVIAAAHSVILMHNHPSGEPEPSVQDFSVTNALKAAGGILRINLMDHVIIGNRRYYSFAEHGRL